MILEIENPESPIQDEPDINENENWFSNDKDKGYAICLDMNELNSCFAQETSGKVNQSKYFKHFK